MKTAEPSGLPTREYLYFPGPCYKCWRDYVRKVAVRRKDRRYIYVPESPRCSCGPDGEALTSWPTSGKPIVNLKSWRLDRQELEKNGQVLCRRKGDLDQWFYVGPPSPEQVKEAEKHISQRCYDRPPEKKLYSLLEDMDEMFKQLRERRFLQPTDLATFGLTRSCTTDDVRRAFRALALRHHPDRGGVADEFAEMTAAYQRLLTYCASATG
jgi:hypothetical protein